MSFFVLVGLAVIIGVLWTLFFEALSLWVTTKIFKMNETYGKSFKVSSLFILICSVVGFLTVTIFYFLKAFYLGMGLNFIVSFFVANFLYKKYFATSIRQNLKIFVVKFIFIGIFSPLITGILIILPIRMFLFQPFFVQGETMVPNYNNDDYLLVKRYDKKYQRGDVVIFRNPQKTEQFLIKRIVGLPGEKIEIRDRTVYINGKVLDESGYLGKNIDTGGEVKEKIIGSGEYFVLGDNRSVSYDSRAFGAVSEGLFEGKVGVKLWSR